MSITRKKNKTPEQAQGFLDINLFLSQPFNLNEFRKATAALSVSESSNCSYT